MARTLVIAEPGCTHEGSYDALVTLLRVAHEAGADCFKPQWCSNPAKMCERRNAPNYRKYYDWLNFPVEWHQRLAWRCAGLGMQYAVSVYIPEDVATVEPWADYVKISSFEAFDSEIRRAVAQSSRTNITSVGMSPDVAYGDGLGKLLHCVSAYPAPTDEMNLSILRKPWCWGLSDHSRDLDMGMMAVCAGARIIETHYRLYDCTPTSPDYAVAFDPGEFTEYILKIRKAERAMGDGVKRIMPSEHAMLRYKVTA